MNPLRRGASGIRWAQCMATLVFLAVLFLPATAMAQSTGDTFRDCAECPEMVAVPAGSFMMGSNSGYGNERPRHRVTIGRPFAVGKYEVTFRQWDACVEGGGCKGYEPDDEGWGRGDRPVINVGWRDAWSYVLWLSRKSGKRYRLLSEAEWEYAARAGTTTPYHFGTSISPYDANFNQMEGRTVRVGSYAANAFGLHDTHGNVWEWVEDCYHDSYRGAPVDGGVWQGSCESSSDGSTYHVLRGGSWINGPGVLRSAIRNWGTAGSRGNGNGFRVARTVD